MIARSLFGSSIEAVPDSAFQPQPSPDSGMSGTLVAPNVPEELKVLPYNLTDRTIDGSLCFGQNCFCSCAKTGNHACGICGAVPNQATAVHGYVPYKKGCNVMLSNGESRYVNCFCAEHFAMFYVAKGSQQGPVCTGIVCKAWRHLAKNHTVASEDQPVWLQEADASLRTQLQDAPPGLQLADRSDEDALEARVSALEARVAALDAILLSRVSPE